MGCAGKLTASDEVAFRNLLVFDTVRGEDSTGIAAVSSKGVVSVVKEVGSPFLLFDTSNGSLLFKQANHVLLGHNRYATTGKVTRRNAHPFEFDTLVGAHNGTLHNKYDIPEHGNFEVDSQALYACIEKEGLVKAMSRVRGAWALSWYDKEACSINFLRNAERPLFYVYAKGGEKVYWASERWMLDIALSKNKIEYGKIKELAENTHVSFSQEDGKITGEVRQQVKGAAPLPATTGRIYPIGAPRLPATTPVITTSMAATTISPTYLGTKGKFKLSGGGIDEAGGAYMKLIDPTFPSYNIRLYVNQNNSHLQTSNADEVVARIISIKKGNFGVFYKASFQEYIKKAAIILPDDDDCPKDKAGNEVTMEDHYKYYANCMWCNADLTYDEDGMVYTDRESGACCKQCKTNETVQSFI